MTISVTHFLACSKPATTFLGKQLNLEHQKKKNCNNNNWNAIKSFKYLVIPMSSHRTLGSRSIISLLTCSIRRGSKFLNFSGSSPSGPHSISKLRRKRKLVKRLFFFMLFISIIMTFQSPELQEGGGGSEQERERELQVLQAYSTVLDISLVQMWQEK